MDTNYLNKAKHAVPNIPLLINMVSRRVQQLNLGERPYVKPDDRNQPKMDIALKEIAEGKLTAEMNLAPSMGGVDSDKLSQL